MRRHGRPTRAPGWRPARPAVHESPSATFRAVSKPVRLASVPPDVIRPAELCPAETQPLADGVDDGVLDGGRPGPHFVDRHHLVRDAADEIEQRGQRHRGRDLVADVVGMVQVLAAGEGFAGRFRRCARRFRRWSCPSSRATLAGRQETARLRGSACAGSFQFSTLVSRDSTRRKWSATTSQQASAGRFERRRDRRRRRCASREAARSCAGAGMRCGAECVQVDSAWPPTLSGDCAYSTPSGVRRLYSPAIQRGISTLYHCEKRFSLGPPGKFVQASSVPMSVTKW